MDFDDLDVVDADDGAAATSDINIQDEGGEAGDVSIDSHEVVVVVNMMVRQGLQEKEQQHKHQHQHQHHLQQEQETKEREGR